MNLILNKVPWVDKADVHAKFHQAKWYSIYQTANSVDVLATTAGPLNSVHQLVFFFSDVYTQNIKIN